MLEKKKICFDARRANDGGIGTYIRNLLAHFPSSLPFSLTVIVRPPSLGRDTYLREPLVLPQGTKSILCDAADYSWREQWQLPRIIPPCDLFWSPHFTVPLAPVRSRRRVMTLHDVLPLSELSPLRKWEKVYARFIISQAIKKSQRIVTVSQFSKREILRLTRAREEAIEVIPIAADPALFHAEDTEGEDLRVLERYAIEKPYFLAVGNQKKHKNLAGIFDGFGRFLRHTQIQATLVVVGSGAGLRHTETIQKILRSAPEITARVQPIGFVPNAILASLYRQATALVFPSLYEGFGLPPLEAMSCGCPTIVSRGTSLEEVCGDAGYYVDPRDPAAIARSMEDLSLSLSQRRILVRQSQKRAASFSWSRVADRHLALIEASFASL